MIPGSISKLSEGILQCADIIKVYNDFVRITGSGTITTIIPGLGTSQGQYLMIAPMDGTITLGDDGNILGSLVVPRYRVITLVFSKPLQKWLLPAAEGLEGEGEDVAETVYIPYNPLDFFADNGGTWTAPSGFIWTSLYYVHGKRVTISLVSGNSIVSPPNTVKQLRMRLPLAVSKIILQGPHSTYPDQPGSFVGSSIVATDIDQIAATVVPTYCVVSDNGADVPWANMSITMATGNFPTSPSGYFVILASCTYIIV